MHWLHSLLHFSVADFAEDKLKIFGSRFDWNCKPIVLRIYSLFHGSLQPQSRQPQQGRPSSTTPGTKLELQRSPVHIRLKLKLVPYLMKSDAAADVFPQSVQVHLHGCHTCVHSIMQAMYMQYMYSYISQIILVLNFIIMETLIWHVDLIMQYKE